MICGATGAIAVVLPPVMAKHGNPGVFICVMFAGLFQLIVGLCNAGRALLIGSLPRHGSPAPDPGPSRPRPHPRAPLRNLLALIGWTHALWFCSSVSGSSGAVVLGGPLRRPWLVVAAVSRPFRERVSPCLATPSPPYRLCWRTPRPASRRGATRRAGAVIVERCGCNASVRPVVAGGLPWCGLSSSHRPFCCCHCAGKVLTTLIPQSVMVGFCNGLAVVIGAAQFHSFAKAKPPCTVNCTTAAADSGHRRLSAFGAFSGEMEWIEGAEMGFFWLHILTAWACDRTYAGQFMAAASWSCLEHCCVHSLIPSLAFCRGALFLVWFKP